MALRGLSNKKQINVDLVTLPNLLNIRIYKKDLKRALMVNQSSGKADEWQSGNFLIFNIPGLRKSRRNLTSQNYSPSDYNILKKINFLGLGSGGVILVMEYMWMTYCYNSD